MNTMGIIINFELNALLITVTRGVKELLINIRRAFPPYDGEVTHNRRRRRRREDCRRSKRNGRQETESSRAKELAV